VTESGVNKRKINRKKALFQIFFFGMIEYIVLNIYIITSAMSSIFNWTVQELTTTNVGFFIQILELIASLIGIYLFVQVLVYFALLLTQSNN
jgi:hypothetical protein